MGHIDETGRGIHLYPVDGYHDRAKLAGLGSKEPFFVVQGPLLKNFLDHVGLFGRIGP